MILLYQADNLFSGISRGLSLICVMCNTIIIFNWCQFYYWRLAPWLDAELWNPLGALFVLCLCVSCDNASTLMNEEVVVYRRYCAPSQQILYIVFALVWFVQCSCQNVLCVTHSNVQYELYTFFTDLTWIQWNLLSQTGTLWLPWAIKANWTSGFHDNLGNLTTCQSFSTFLINMGQNSNETFLWPQEDSVSKKSKYCFSLG